MNDARHALTPEALSLVQTIARTGSFAAAARALDLVPSALTYRVRQLEEALDVLLFDRRSRQAQLTAAGQELLREGERLLAEMEAVTHRVKRVATGWESGFTVAVDSVIHRETVMDLCESFLALGSPTRLRLRDETLSGTLEALTSGQADLALGLVGGLSQSGPIHYEELGHLPFVFAVAPHHALAHEPRPWSPEQIARHRAVAVADTAQRLQSLTIGLQAGQDVFTVPTMQAKLDAQLRGLGVGSLPLPMAEPHLQAGRLIGQPVQDPMRSGRLGYAWRRTAGTARQGGRALQWWLQQLKSESTRRALIQSGPPASPKRGQKV